MSTWIISDGELYHHGIKGQKWGIRRYQNEDGTLTPEGVKRYGTVENFEKAQHKKKIAGRVAAGVGAGLAITGAAVGTGLALANRDIKNKKRDDLLARAVSKQKQAMAEHDARPRQIEARGVAEKRGIVPKGFFGDKAVTTDDARGKKYSSIADSLTPEKMAGAKRHADSAITKMADVFVSQLSQMPTGPEHYMGKHR